ncbi:MAG: ThiF family adenylyltransferase [Bacteriovorax sp.]|nr:ThiF family adenylyltransferase [Bacteriovorax sp.]
MNKYKELFQRNSGYIPESLQDKISSTRLLVAGCGLGSAFAVSAARIGFQHFVLVDGDTVDVHNLNRQAFFQRHIGKSKVESLKEIILDINPEAQIETHMGWLSESNAKSLVDKVDIVFDTIDFLDLPAIVSLHDEAQNQKKPLFSAFSAAWGAVGFYCPPTSKKKSYIREILNLPDGSLQGLSYVEYFLKFFVTIAPRLNPEVVDAMAQVFDKMKDQKPCPAPHVVVGAETLASLGLTMICSQLKGEKVISAPELIIIDFTNFVLQK